MTNTTAARTTRDDDEATTATTATDAAVGGGDDDRTERHFADRIEALRATISDGLPSPSSSSSAGGGCGGSAHPAVRAFVDSSRALRSSAATLKRAEDLLDGLKKKADHRADDDDADLIKEAQALVDQCEEGLDAAWDCEKETGLRLMDELDLPEMEASLLECTVITQATPKGLADFCSQGKSNVKLLDEFLSNKDWMKLMISGGGASFGAYGRAIQIHSDLLQQIKDESTEVRRKLALAVSLEHADPISYRFQQQEGQQHQCVDPSARFWHYVNAYENGELDPAFEHFTVWELRLVVDCNASEAEMQWGRDYLKAYRPDQVTSTNDRWKYIWTVRTDINYHHPEHEFRNYKELLSAGGVCGARAWFGRFIAKSFGMPTWGVRQPGHAAISRWTPAGWVTCLGGGFRSSHFTEKRYAAGKRFDRGGLDFEEETKARTNACSCDYYERMCLLECLAESLGETVIETIDPTKCWRSLSLVQRRVFVQASKDCASTHHQQDERSSSMDAKSLFFSREMNQANRHQQGECYIIPASNFSCPPSKALLVMPSFLGGDQVHLSSAKYYATCDDGTAVPDASQQEEADDGDVTYAIPSAIPKGSYDLSFKIVTVHRFQPNLKLSVEGFVADDDGLSFDDAVDVHEIEVPNTVGAWKMTPGVRLFLSPGSVIRISRESPCHGLTIKELVLDPIA